MARKPIDIGTIGNDGTGDSIRDAFRKVNDNFRELYSSLGLGERLTFIALNDVKPSLNEDSYGTYNGQVDNVTGSTPLLTVNNDESGVMFKRLVGGNGISIDFITDDSQIVLNSEFSEISADPSPQLGGDLYAQSGGNQWRILGLDTPTQTDEAANKNYVDTKVSRFGVDAIDPATGLTNATLGRMAGPLILSRSPVPEDDEIYGGLIAATKSYVDGSAFGSVANLYVATSGEDDRPGVSPALQGRALAYAYRTIEAACKRAEELLLESRNEIGPYKKLLTYDQGAQYCTLSSIETSPVSGAGFAGTVTMSVDTVTLADGGAGSNYFVGDIITLGDGVAGVAPGGQSCRIEVLSTATTPGGILTFRLVSTGAYSSLPGSSAVGTSIVDSAAPPGVLAVGAGAKFNVTYKVNSVAISSQGSGYSLVSVRIEGGGGSGAFGTAYVVGGQITGITITDQGSGFTSIPTVKADLPRLAIFTNNLRTDYTGDVLTDTPQAYRGRDIREGLYLRGENSGALAQILGHSGELDSLGNELFDVDIQYGAFEIGEPIAYGDVTKNTQITILVESGIYEENLPIKVPQNTSIVGDEFRRCIVRPKPGTSSSPWAFLHFRRDLVMDGMNTATQEFGFHYLQDPTQPVYPKIQNPGFYDATAKLLELNRNFIAEEVIAWINYQIDNNQSPFTDTFEYNQNLCKRDVGLIVDALIFDLKYGSYNRTISAGLKYYGNASGRIAIGAGQISQTLAGVDRINYLAQIIIDNVDIPTLYQTTYSQIIDKAYTSETGSDIVIDDLITALKDVMDGSGSVNYPKENDQMDVFLANDAVRWQALTCQGHGGFMCVLDPTGQILAKSPYAQECASFSKSINRQTFAGGMFIDGFAGNLQFKMINKISNTRIEVSGLDRFPQLPCSFIVNDSVYRINYIRDFVYDKDGSTATFVLDETTPWTDDLFTYNEAICNRDVGYLIDGLQYDIVFGSNYHARKAGLTYRQANAEVVVETQLDLTVRAIEYAHDQAAALLNSYPTQQSSVQTLKGVVSDIVSQGEFYAPAISLPAPPGLSTLVNNARTLLLANIQYLQDEVIGYLGSAYPSLNYNPTTCARDVEYIVYSLVYDIIYGGNSQTVDAGLKYYDGVGSAITLQIASGELTATVAAINHLKYLAKQVVQNLNPTTSYSFTPRVTGSATDASTVSLIDTLMTEVADIVQNGVGAAASITYPNISSLGYGATPITASGIVFAAKSTIQTSTIDFVNTNANLYEILMPGNRSILSNDFTQVNDLGYGIFATNGGLVEAVSMFTYYAHISYYALNGAQIRSVSGSSAHGNYALVAEGSDPLETPTPTSLYSDLSQKVKCYAPSLGYANSAGGLFIYVTAYDTVPLNSSELEVNHGGLIFRYPITSVTAGEGLPTGVARLNLTADPTSTSDGLYDDIPDGTVMTLRQNAKVILTNNLVEVSVRPSTGLRLVESGSTVYRVLQFEAYNDPLGPFEIQIIPGSPGRFRVLTEVVEIASNVCTTASNHRLRKGDRFIPTSSSNGLLSGITYYVIDVPEYNQFKLATSANGSAVTLTNGTGLSIKGAKTHKLQSTYTISFSTTGTLPAPLVNGDIYYVISTGLSNTEFQISDIKNGNALIVTTAGSGTHKYDVEGLTLTTLRENYNYVNLTLFSPGEYKTTPKVCTISIGSPAIITSASHGFSIGDVIKFTTSLNGTLPTGLVKTLNYHIVSTGFTSNQFCVAELPEYVTGSVPIDTTGSGGSGTFYVGKVTGAAGDTSFAVTALSPAEAARADGTKFVYLGEEYVITNYESSADTNEEYGRVNLNRPLVNSIINLAYPYAISAGVPIRTVNSSGSLTIRISLTRVTSHDLLEIGTGSYADTNYPNEIYGQSVNGLNDQQETEERDVGRVFYVTTDQFGNFKVGPYFSVDQGTGRVKFSAAIALSNLDGIGFKRGVAVSEFSTDASFADNATDTVPTENATRIYIEKRLGITHGGSIVPDAQLIPTLSGGFMSLDGQLSMKADMDIGNHKIVNLSDPTNPQDAVNLRSLTFANLQEFTITDVESADLLVFTGAGNFAENATVVGDIQLTLDSTANTVDAQINPGVIVNADVNASAAIAQSKLAMNAATTRANATGIAQADRGLASFDEAEFTVTNGWVELKTSTANNNGIPPNKIQQMASKTVLGNSTLGTANATEVPFSDVVNLGLSIKKSQYSTTGLLRRTNATSSSADGDYTIIEASAAYTGSSDNNKLIQRDSNGDFAARIANLSKLQIDTKDAVDTATTATGGYVRFFGYDSAGGILIENGSLAGDKKTSYWNNNHVFKTQDGVSDAPITCSSIQTLLLTTGGNTTNGQITGRWTLTGTSPTESRLQATYSADLAEYYEGDKEYEVGTVLVFGGDKEVTTTNVKGDTRIAGVVSNTAAFVMYDACPGFKNLVALQGRVPCRVVGKISKGDILIASGIPGVAVAATGDVKVGTVVGKALTNYDSDHIGTIEIAVGRT